MSEISVREATTADVRHILRHRRAMFEAMGERDNAALEAMHVSSEAYFPSALQDGSYRAWLAETTEGTIVAGGGIVISDWPALPRAPQARRATILNMYTEPEFRRRGIARRLMLIMLAWLEQQGFSEVDLHASDSGRSLYQQLGFRATNELRLGLPGKAPRDLDYCCSPASPRRTSIGDEVRRSRKIGGFTVRKATARDATSIQRCLAATFAPFQGLYTSEAFADTVPTAAALQQRLATMCLFVAEFDDHVIGTVGCNNLKSGEGHLRGMAVLPEWQGSPVAAALLGAAEAEIRQQGCTRLKLDTTEPLQRAIRFYDTHGFRHSGRVADFFGMSLHEYVKEL